nr:hypothetical protein [Tanacetum cinerariifolium]
MVSYVNVLGPGVLDIIRVKSNGTAIITIEGNLIEGKAVVCKLRCLIPSTHAYNGYNVGSAGSEHPWRTCYPKETMTKCYTMPEEPALNHIEPSSDDKHVSDGLDQ